MPRGMRRAWQIATSIMLAVCLLMVWQSLRLPLTDRLGPGPRERIELYRDRLASDLANGWGEVKPREFEFDGKTFRKPGGIAPQMVWDKDTNQMVLQLYIGANKALPVPLRPVAEFHDSPWAQG